VADAAERGLALRTAQLDVAREESCRQAFRECAEMTGGGPWALVNDAGIPQAGTVADVDDVQARRLLEVNLLGPARLCRLVLPTMAARGGGRIVNSSSGLGRVPWPMGAWYSAGKHALSALTPQLGQDATEVKPATPDGQLLTRKIPGAERRATPKRADRRGDLPGRATGLGGRPPRRPPDRHGRSWGPSAGFGGAGTAASL
jgi:NAD(P)-dependent dehydrogenase (short-subunit alcohol dehydrogenase family)